MTDAEIYIGDCTLFSNDYSGPAITLSMQGCNLSSTHISMTLKPNQQKQIIEWFCKHRRALVEKSMQQRRYRMKSYKVGDKRPHGKITGPWNHDKGEVKK